MRVKDYAFDVDDPESMYALEMLSSCGEPDTEEDDDDEYLEALLGISEEN